MLSLPPSLYRFPGDFLASKFQVQCPDTRLIQYDCGKLQILSKLLQTLQAGSHRALIFTQMTKILDILESFLSFHGHTYMRLDGSTKVEQRQMLMERFNANSKYFVFILSTRSGGVGINLTGADTVIFYDSDWNPTMDAQAQDRCHRIGQTRDVHIYRLVSERTIEENILKKANQKRLLGDLAIEGGNFTTAYFKKSTIRDLFDENEQNNDTNITEVVSNGANGEEESTTNVTSDKRATKAFVSAISAVEDNIDSEALKKASKEVEADEAEFDEEVKPDDGLGTLMKQLNPVEKYAFNHVEHIQKFWKECQIAAIDAEIEAQKKEFDEKKLEEMAEAIGAGASATPTEDGSTASETDVDEGGDDSSDDGDDSDDSSSDEDDRATGDDNDTENTEPTDSDDSDNNDENSIAIESDQEEKPIKSLKINTSKKFLKKSRKKSKKDNPLSPRTRSRGDVRINLWNLDKE